MKLTVVVHEAEEGGFWAVSRLRSYSPTSTKRSKVAYRLTLVGRHERRRAGSSK